MAVGKTGDGGIIIFLYRPPRLPVAQRRLLREKIVRKIGATDEQRPALLLIFADRLRERLHPPAVHRVLDQHHRHRDTRQIVGGIGDEAGNGMVVFHCRSLRRGGDTPILEEPPGKLPVIVKRSKGRLPAALRGRQPVFRRIMAGAHKDDALIGRLLPGSTGKEGGDHPPRQQMVRDDARHKLPLGRIGLCPIDRLQETGLFIIAAGEQRAAAPFRALRPRPRFLTGRALCARRRSAARHPSGRGRLLQIRLYSRGGRHIAGCRWCRPARGAGRKAEGQGGQQRPKPPIHLP